MESKSQDTFDVISHKYPLRTQIINNISEEYIEAVNSFEEYEDLYRIRHDFCHSLLCSDLQIDFGEKTIENIIPNLMQIFYSMGGDKADWELIKKQTPDIVIVNGRNVKIMEISVSSRSDMESYKITKYALMSHLLHNSGYNVINTPVIIDPNGLLDEHHLKNAGYSDSSILMMIKILNIIKKMIHRTMRDPNKRHWHSKFVQLVEDTWDTGFTSQDCVDIYNSVERKPFKSVDDLSKIFFRSQHELDDVDDEFIEYCVDKLDLITSPLEHGLKPNVEIIKQYHRMNKTTSHFRPIFSICYLPIEINLTMDRRTWDDESKIQNCLSMFRDSHDEVLKHIGRNWNNGYLKLPLELMKIVAQEGPERKKYQRKGMVLEKQYTNSYMDIDINTSPIHDISLKFSKKVLNDEKDPLSIDGPGLRYLKQTQELYRELCINSMRKTRKDQFIIRPLAEDGVFIIIYPGAKLRVGETASSVFFKIIIETSSITSSPYLNNVCFHSLKHAGSLYQSSWLSADAYRIDHFLRCYDKVLMSYLTYIDKSRSGGDIISKIISDSSNVLGLMIITYCEDRRVTSKMLQDCRYMIMSCLSITRYSDKVLDRFKVPLRSSLQIYYLNKMLNYYQNFSFKDFSAIKFGSFSSDILGLSETMSGSLLIMKRPLSSGEDISFEQVLCEMYFCMLFNKDQDDVTHSSFQILTKMLEGEELLENSKKEDLQFGYSDHLTDLEYVDKLLSYGAAGCFSRKAMEIGSVLQSISSDVNIPGPASYKEACTKNNVNKSLDEFATYKSSSIDHKLIFENAKDNFNRRTKCISSVIGLLNDGCKNSIDVIKKTKDDEIQFQVFKKNQIGGVREILILKISNRIQINILETISRNLCANDGREMLTSGAVKNEIFQKKMIKCKKAPGKRFLLHLNFDKTKWGPTFIPIQFIYLYTRFSDQMASFFPYMVHLLIKHQNKKCIIPNQLIKAWLRHPKKQHTHDNAIVQKIKDNFFKTQEMYFTNESNMGQGILHYTSSFLHLCMLSFRDELLKRYCIRNNWEPFVYEDVLSSDDSYTCISLNRPEGKDQEDLKKKKNAFLRAQHLSEVLFNCRTSLSKSSISLIIAEFNSLFAVNLNMIPATIKFALSSTTSVNTDSFYRMVKESYNQSRSYVENGGSIEMYQLIHRLNKSFCESMYHTAIGAQNDLSEFNISMNNISYQMGHYPIFDPTIMLMYGPEFHNYEIFRRIEKLTSNEKILFTMSHKLIDLDTSDLLPEVENPKSLFGSLLRIEARVRPVSILNNMRDNAKSKLGIDRMSIKERVDNDIFFMFESDKNDLERIKIRTVMKLYLTTSNEAARNTSYSIMFGRMSASVSANAFHIPNSHWQDDMSTFKDCVIKLLNNHTGKLITDTEMEVLYPLRDEYDSAPRDSKMFDYNLRNELETRMIRTMNLTKPHNKISNRIIDVLKFIWQDKKVPSNLEKSYYRDWRILKYRCPILKDDLNLTLKGLPDEGSSPSQKLNLILMRVITASTKTIKGAFYGYDSKDSNETYWILNGMNFYSDLTSSILPTEMRLSNKKMAMNIPELYWKHNIFMLMEEMDSEVVIPDLITKNDVITIIEDPFMSRSVKKRFTMIALKLGYIENPEVWTRKTGDPLHQWIEKQRRIEGKYIGDFELRVQLSSQSVRVEGNETSVRIYYSAGDSYSMKKMFDRVGQLLEDGDWFKKAQEGPWMQLGDQIVNSGNAKSGFVMRLMTHEPVEIIERYVFKFNSKFSILTNMDGDEIMKIPKGLLETTYHDDQYQNLELINVYGLRLDQVSKLRCFKDNFNPKTREYKDLKSCFWDIKDTTVHAFSVSKNTNQRLEMDYPEETEPILETEAITFDPMSIFTSDEITLNDLSELKGDLSDSKNENDHFELLFDIQNFINESSEIKKIYQTWKIYKIVTRLKSIIICSFITDYNRINSDLIKVVKIEDLKLHLILVYDLLYMNVYSRSPRSTNIELDPNYCSDTGLTLIKLLQM